jgi:hypothetical protein
VPLDLDFSNQGDQAPIVQLPRRAGARTWIKAGCAAVVLIVAAAGYWHRDRLAAYWQQAASAGENEVRPPPRPPLSPEAPRVPVPNRPYPRRLLVISVHNYLYANPVGIDSGQSGISALVARLANALHIDASQVTLLSDMAAAGEARPPLKKTMEEAITQFFSTCRRQDRIVVMFAGHAVELDNEAFLVPIDGELALRETLIPLQWLYQQLGLCPAEQKVLVVDVCRFNPIRGMERPGTGPMGQALNAALNDPPPGVQLWCSCVAGQQSYEGPVGPDGGRTGGFFLSELAEAVGSYQRKVSLGTQSADDAIPLELLANGDGAQVELGSRRIDKGVNSCTSYAAQEWYGLVQTPRLRGQAPATAGAYDPEEALPPRISLSATSVNGVKREAIERILDETENQMTREHATPLHVDALPAFSAEKMAEYSDDGETTPFRARIVRATQTAKKHARAFNESFDQSAIDKRVKSQTLRRQHEPARVMAELLGELENLLEAEPERAEEKSKRWQAHYDYVVARLYAHLAYVHEYSYMLGQIRKEALPPLDPKKHKRWRLASTATLQSGADGRKMAAEAKKRLEKLAREHAGTPWEIMAKRQAVTALGLDWQPSP